MSKPPNLWDQMLMVAPDWFAEFVTLMNDTNKSVIKLTAFLTAPATVFAFVEDPIGTFEALVQVLLSQRVTVPLAEAVLDAGAGVIDTVLLISFGSNHAPGAGGGQLGLLDIPIVLFDSIVGVGVAVFTPLMMTIQSFNSLIANAAASLGLAAAPVVVILVAIEAVVGMFILYHGTQLALELLTVLDIPVVGTGAIVDSVRRVLDAARDAVTIIYGVFR